MTYAGVSASNIAGICLTHLHGDHCLGLPGVLPRLAVGAGIGRRLPVRLDPVPVADSPGAAVSVDDAAHGIEGLDVGRLARDGRIEIGDRWVSVGEVSEVRPGHSMAVVMDTGVCDAAASLAEGVDLLLCEATFLESDVDLALEHHHLTARQAATIAREAGVRLLVLTHFSARYPDLDGHRREAGAVFPDVIAAEDLMVVAFPRP